MCETKTIDRTLFVKFPSAGFVKAAEKADCNVFCKNLFGKLAVYSVPSVKRLKETLIGPLRAGGITFVQGTRDRTHGLGGRRTFDMQ